MGRNRGSSKKSGTTAANQSDITSTAENAIVRNIIKVGHISFDKNAKLGTGSGGTHVYEGTYINNTPAAVKRVLKGIHFDVREIGHLLAITHENVVRFMGKEEDDDFIYLALELCDCTLEYYMENENSRINLDMLQRKHLLFQITNGLSFLHAENIIHRDLKPKNILLKNNVIKITDFGLSRQIEEDRSSVTVTHAGAGSKGWRALEILNGKPGDTMTKAVDIFALGCVFHYVLAKSNDADQKHPFSDEIHREVNIQKSRRHSYISQINQTLSHDSVLADVLISQAINKNSDARPSCQIILKHPFFWTPSTTMSFIVEFHNSFMNSNHANDNLIYKFEQEWQHVYKLMYPSINQLFGWIGEINKVDKYFVDSIIRQRKYKYSSLNPKDLLRLIRNINQHSTDILSEHPILEEMFQEHGVPVNPNGIMNYFLNMFPLLVIILYNSVSERLNRVQLPDTASAINESHFLNSWCHFTRDFIDAELKLVAYNDVMITRQLERVMKLIKLVNKGQK